MFDCPNCAKESRFYRIRTKKVYGCEHCGYQISPTAGTIFHKSSTSLTTWFYVIYLMAQTRGGISAKQIERETGVTYKTAWRMCNLIRKVLFEDLPPLMGTLRLMSLTSVGDDTASEGVAHLAKLLFLVWSSVAVQ
ncbi:MAG: IS1595 family transposase [Chloroflexi bacterium]|nr:IS1595 family transposase [Chloroflexota bacterium]